MRKPIEVELIVAVMGETWAPHLFDIPKFPLQVVVVVFLSTPPSFFCSLLLLDHTLSTDGAAGTASWVFQRSLFPVPRALELDAHSSK